MAEKNRVAEILELHRKYAYGESGGKRLVWSELSDKDRADLRSADLYGADLRSADLRSADLYGADLRSADLSSADLYGADLSSADLYGADLSSADLSGTDLSSANLSGTDLSSAKGIIAIGPIGSRSGITYAVFYDDKIMVLCGCFWGALYEFEQAVKGTHGDNQHGREYRAMIQFLHTIAETRGYRERADGEV